MKLSVETLSLFFWVKRLLISVCVCFMSSTPQSRSRRRKIAVLTQSGLQKLQAAQSQSNIWNNYTKTCTLEVLSERTGLSTHTLSKVHARNASVDLRTLVRYFSAFNLPLEPSDYRLPAQDYVIDETDQVARLRVTNPSPMQSNAPNVSWGTAPDVSKFCGRAAELATLETWILGEYCRLVTLAGMGGIGKTWLSVRLLEQIQSAFEIVMWRSLRPIGKSPPLLFNDLLDDLLRGLAPQSGSSIPALAHHKFLQLMDCLQKQRCLLVLDNVESILPGAHPKASAGESVDYEAYEELFQLLGQGRHQSCLVLTSREEPKKIQPLSEELRPVRLLRLSGLTTTEIKQLFETRGRFQGSADEWHRLVTYYGGNPFILKTVATAIQRWFNGSIASFLMHNVLLLDDVCQLVDQQLGRLSNSERMVMSILASQAEPCSLAQLRSQIPSSISTVVMLDALKSLGSRSLLEPKAAIEPSFLTLPSRYLRDYINRHC